VRIPRGTAELPVSARHGAPSTASSRGRVALRALDRENGSRAGEKVDARGNKKQGRRRSMPSTTLPAPEIKIGSRLPVALLCPGFVPGNVIQFTNSGGKFWVVAPHNQADAYIFLID
jgi:hypothetical protein